MKLYCYEICDERKSSTVERVIGLGQIGKTQRVEAVKVASDEPLESTNEDLERGDAENQCEIPLFTEIGRMAFRSAIENVAATYTNGPFYVKEISVELSECALSKIRNTDDYQVQVDGEFYDELKAARYMLDK